jgi:hypothetical protein
MAFPWELNLDRTYGDEKSFPERARGESTDSVFSSSGEKLDAAAGAAAGHEGPDAESPAKRKPRLPSHRRGW